jgi:hypothetical protein
VETIGDDNIEGYIPQSESRRTRSSSKFIDQKLRQDMKQNQNTKILIFLFISLGQREEGLMRKHWI